MKGQILYIIILLLLLSSLTDIFPQYAINKSVTGNGSSFMQNSNYVVSGTLGQTIIGINTNSTRQNHIGFWYQVNSVVTAVENESDNLPNEFKLYQNYPNPFNPTTTIEYSIPSSSVIASGAKQSKEITSVNSFPRNDVNVTLKVYNILGKEVTTLVNKKQSPGVYEVTFDASNLPSGVYIYKIHAGSFKQSRKLLLMK